MHDLLIANARIVSTTADVAPSEPVDVVVRSGRVSEIAPPGRTSSAGSSMRRLDASGRFLIPGLWDHHVHATQWARTMDQLDTAGTASAEEVVALVAQRIAAGVAAPTTVFGWGHRPATWPRAATVAQLDAVSGDVPVVLTSGDGHSGWLNSAALRRLGAPPRDDAVREAEWFALFARLDELGDPRDGDVSRMREAVARAHAQGIVGITDMEFGRGWDVWRSRVAAGIDTMHVRTATYPDTLDEILHSRLATGDVIEGASGRVRMGPLKIIADGSLNTCTAWCREPYAVTDPSLAPSFGAPNLPVADLRDLFLRGTAGGLEVACHAIGDAAVGAVLDAFAVTRARGTIEHAQLTSAEDVRRMALLDVSASVQPAHIWDDRDVAQQLWAENADRCFMLRSMLDAGVALRLGSDAPVSPLNPWEAMAAAVHRSGDDRPAWNPAEAITAREALAASIDGASTVGVGSRGDLVLIDDDPCPVPSEDTAAASRRLRGLTVASTVVAGRVVHDTIG